MKIKSINIRKRSKPWKKSSSSIFIFPDGENLLEQLHNRRSRPYTIYRKKVLPQVFKTLGLPRNTKAHWSQKCGCSCPCSPGFHLHATLGPDQDPSLEWDQFCDIYVTIE